MSKAPLLWSLTLASSAAALAYSGHRASSARAAAERARAEHTRVRAQAQELLALRAQADKPGAGGPGAGPGLTQRLTAALTQARLPPAALSNLTPEPPSPSPEQPGLQRQRATLSLTGLSLPQLGAFLEAWRTAEPAWTITRIDLAPQGGPAPSAGGDLPLRTGLTLEALTPQEPTPGAHP